MLEPYAMKVASTVLERKSLWGGFLIQLLLVLILMNFLLFSICWTQVI